MAEIKFEFPESLIFGNKEILRLGSEASIWGERILLISDSVHNNTGTIEHVKGILERKKLKVLVYGEVNPSASTFNIEEAISVAKGSHSQVIIGMGGVRALSFAKAVSFVAGGEGNIDDFFTDKVNRQKSIPLILIPTSMRDPFLLSESCFLTETRQRTSNVCHIPQECIKQIIVDPSLTVSLPAKYSSLILMEVLLSSIEAFLSNHNSFLIETLTLDVIRKISLNIDAITENQGDLNLRKIACEASVALAMALSMTGPLPGLMLSYSTGSYFKIPRVSVVSILYPYIFDSPIYGNSEKLKEVSDILVENLNWDILSENDSLSSIIRSMSAKLNHQIRLEDLKVNVDELSICSDITSSIIMKTQNTIATNALFDILKEAY